MDLGYKAAIVCNATGSPGRAHQIDIDRIRRADGIIVSAKSLYYEWARTMEKALAFEDSGIQMPEGIIL